MPKPQKNTNNVKAHVREVTFMLAFMPFIISLIFGGFSWHFFNESLTHTGDKQYYVFIIAEILCAFAIAFCLIAITAAHAYYAHCKHVLGKI